MSADRGFGDFSAEMDGSNNTSEFRGRLVNGQEASFRGLIIELNAVDGGTFRQRTEVLSDGSFWFRGINQGDYVVRVLTPYGEEITSVLASADQGGMPVEIRMPDSHLEKPPSGTVTLQELNHPISKQVRKLLEGGRRLVAKEDYNGAVERFREATKQDPDSPEAHADLGQALTRLGDWNAAREEYRAAVALDPANSILHSNLAAALAQTRNLDEAQSEDATALKLDSHNARAHFVMAAIILQRKGSVQEALTHLLAAQDNLPAAKEAATKICAESRIHGCP